MNRRWRNFVSPRRRRSDPPFVGLAPAPPAWVPRWNRRAPQAVTVSCRDAWTPVPSAQVPPPRSPRRGAVLPGLHRAGFFSVPPAPVVAAVGTVPGFRVSRTVSPSAVRRAEWFSVPATQQAPPRRQRRSLAVSAAHRVGFFPVPVLPPPTPGPLPPRMHRAARRFGAPVRHGEYAQPVPAAVAPPPPPELPLAIRRTTRQIPLPVRSGEVFPTPPRLDPPPNGRRRRVTALPRLTSGGFLPVPEATQVQSGFRRHSQRIASVKRGLFFITPVLPPPVPAPLPPVFRRQAQRLRLLSCAGSFTSVVAEQGAAVPAHVFTAGSLSTRWMAGVLSTRWTSGPAATRWRATRLEGGK